MLSINQEGSTSSLTTTNSVDVYDNYWFYNTSFQSILFIILTYILTLFTGMIFGVNYDRKCFKMNVNNKNNETLNVDTKKNKISKLTENSHFTTALYHSYGLKNSLPQYTE